MTGDPCVPDIPDDGIAGNGGLRETADTTDTTDTNRYKRYNRYKPIQAIQAIQTDTSDTSDTDRYKPIQPIQTDTDRYKPIQSLCEIDDGDAGAAEADVFVAEGGDVGVGFQLLADEGLEDAVACAVKDAEARGVELHGVVEEVGDGLQGFVCPHSSYVDLVLEFERYKRYRPIQADTTDTDRYRPIQADTELMRDR